MLNNKVQFEPHDEPGTVCEKPNICDAGKHPRYDLVGEIITLRGITGHLSHYKITNCYHDGGLLLRPCNLIE